MLVQQASNIIPSLYLMIAVGLVVIENDPKQCVILDSMAVTNDHFQSALRQTNPSSLKETVVEAPNIQWEISEV